LTAFAASFIALQISHRGTVSKIDEDEEVVSMARPGFLSMLGIAVAQTVAAVSSSVGAAAVLG
jgi:hypothetical protein